MTAGLLGSVPLLAGAVLQLAMPALARRAGSVRRWVVLAAALQALVFAPLALAAWHDRISVPALFALTAVYWGLGLAATSGWSSWIDRLVPESRLRGFLAVRSRLAQVAAFLAFLAGGWLLSAAEAEGKVLRGYLLLFALAGLARLASAGFMAAQRDATWPPTPRRPLRETLRHFSGRSGGGCLTFLLTSQVAVYIASPFFTPYMLGHLRFSYGEYAALVSASYVAKILFYPRVARFVSRVGPTRALWLSGLCVWMPPFFWLWTPELGAIITVQVFAGAAWAVFELASMILVFDNLHADERLRILTLFNLLNAAAVVAGSLLGGWALARWPGWSGYATIFVASGIARLVSLGALLGARKGRHASAQPSLEKDLHLPVALAADAHHRRPKVRRQPRHGAGGGELELDGWRELPDHPVAGLDQDPGRAG